MSNWLRIKKLHILCPICGKNDWCLLSKDGCSVICARVRSDKMVGNRGAGWIHRLGVMDVEPLQINPMVDPVVEQSPRAPAGLLHKAYQSLLSELDLSLSHRSDLWQRGLSDSEIWQLGYKTLPKDGRRSLVSRLEKSEVDIHGIPGFYKDRSGRWDLAGPSGLLIPIRNQSREIVALQVRCDQTTGGKYKWVSSRDRLLGCSPGAPPHVPLESLLWYGGEMWLIEGGLKADVASLRFGNLMRRLFVAIAGVGNWPSILPIVRFFHPRRVIIAYDMDSNVNPAVALHRSNLTANLSLMKVSTWWAEWDPRFKGIDDFLTGRLQKCLK